MAAANVDCCKNLRREIVALIDVVVRGEPATVRVPASSAIRHRTRVGSVARGEEIEKNTQDDGDKATSKPLGCHSGNQLESAGFLKKVSRARDNPQRPFTPEAAVSLFVQ